MQMLIYLYLQFYTAWNNAYSLRVSRNMRMAFFSHSFLTPDQGYIHY